MGNKKMKKEAYAMDLHIHSALSPCAHEDMTPNNIVNMAHLKGLDIIAVTDHNSAENLPGIQQCCKEKDILLLPGIEVNSKEEVHLLTYFSTLAMALEFSHILYEHLPPIENNKNIFGTQRIIDKEDSIVDEVRKLLISATDLSIDKIIKIVKEMGGVTVAAHVDKNNNSIFSNLGFVPDYLEFKTLEVLNKEQRSQNDLNSTGRYNIISSSDAHYLWQILERREFIQLHTLSVKELINTL
ncbi:MAG: PHP domain-containing protein [Eubacteriales bacterium]